jgi:hypothetical protein
MPDNNNTSNMGTDYRTAVKKCQEESPGIKGQLAWGLLRLKMKTSQVRGRALDKDDKTPQPSPDLVSRSFDCMSRHFYAILKYHLVDALCSTAASKSTELGL